MISLRPNHSSSRLLKPITFDKDNKLPDYVSHKVLGTVPIICIKLSPNKDRK